jgi:uncharacterized Zn-binding protein involved in type VI secretion
MDRQKTLFERETHNIRSEKKRTSLGLVTDVHSYVTEGVPDRTHAVDVITTDRDGELKDIPVYGAHKDAVAIPQEGDVVQVHTLDGLNEPGFVFGTGYTTNQTPPLARAGHRRQRYAQTGSESLYMEAEPVDHSAGDPETIRFAAKSDGLSDPSVAIEIDNSGQVPIPSLRRNSDAGSDTNDELTITIGESSATIEGDPNDDDDQKLVAGVDNNEQTAFLQVTTTSNDVIELTLDQTDGTIDIVTEGQDVRIGDRNGSFEPIARKGDEVEVNGDTGSITEGSSNVKST